MQQSAADRRLTAEFCDGLAELIDEAEELGIAPQLRATRLALASGSAAPADVIRQFWVAIGLGDGTRAVKIQGQDPTPPPAGDYVCPSGACDLQKAREPGGPVPSCRIYGRPMRYQP
jgi:hypothetical protein